MDARLRRASARGRGRPPVGRGAGPLRRASGGAAAAGVRPGRHGPRTAGGAGHRARGHPEGHALAAEEVSPSPPAGPHRGDAGEDLACEHLRGRGMKVLARNYRCRTGEIDIVADDGGTRRLRRGEGEARRLARLGGGSGDGREAAPGRPRGPRLRGHPRALRLARSLRRAGDRLGAGGPPRAPRRGSLRRGVSRSPGSGGGHGAGNGIRTRDFDLGKVALYH